MACPTVGSDASATAAAAMAAAAAAAVAASPTRRRGGGLARALETPVMTHLRPGEKHSERKKIAHRDGGLDDPHKRQSWPAVAKMVSGQRTGEDSNVRGFQGYAHADSMKMKNEMSFSDQGNGSLDFMSRAHDHAVTASEVHKQRRKRPVQSTVKKKQKKQRSPSSVLLDLPDCTSPLRPFHAGHVPTRRKSTSSTSPRPSAPSSKFIRAVSRWKVAVIHEPSPPRMTSETRAGRALAYVPPQVPSASTQQGRRVEPRRPSTPSSSRPSPPPRGLNV